MIKVSQKIFWLCAAFILPCCCRYQHTIDSDIPVSISEEYLYAENGSSPVEGAWWAPFQREDLNFFMDKIIEDNLDFKASWSKLLAARASVIRAKANKYAEVNIGAGIEVEWTPRGEEEHGVGLGGLIRPTFSYEYDLFGRLEALVKSAFHSYRFSYYDAEALSLALTGDGFDLWVSAKESKALIALYQDQFEISRRLFDLLNLRYIVGDSTALDLNLQKLQLKGLNLDVISEEASFNTSNNGLYVLIGQSPGQSFNFSSEFDIQLPPMPLVGSPADLLFNRPDLKRAYENFLSSGFDLKAAILNCYPKLVFPISLEIAIGGLKNIWEEALVEAAVMLVGPFFDGGRRKSDVQKARALVEENLFKIGSLFLTAIAEVEDALVEEKKAASLIESLQDQLKIAKVILQMAEESYALGIVEYLTVIATIQKTQALERELIRRKADLIRARGKLYRSLGNPSFC